MGIICGKPTNLKKSDDKNKIIIYKSRNNNNTPENQTITNKKDNILDASKERKNSENLVLIDENKL